MATDRIIMIDPLEVKTIREETRFKFDLDAVRVIAENSNIIYFLGIENEEVEGYIEKDKEKLFIIYDKIYPETVEEWDDWEQMIEDDFFYIDEDEYEKVYFDMFARPIENDFIETEYVKVRKVETEDEAFISIDIGITWNGDVD